MSLFIMRIGIHENAIDISKLYITIDILIGHDVFHSYDHLPWQLAWRRFERWTLLEIKLD